tara:strand:- start:7367 stop:10363 length:2997 start_codon:yes stop_codon:yes gene_type:complete
MTEAVHDFYRKPIINRPYEAPTCHWELDDEGQPTGRLIEERRPSKNITPIPQPKKRGKQANLPIGLDEASQTYDPTPVIDEIRLAVAKWRNLPPEEWGVTYETQILLQHWRRQHEGIRPFFCQMEAIETIIWLTEVANSRSPEGRKFWEFIRGSNQASNPDLMRMCMKLATGAGKTTVMAMIIVWQTVNAVRRPQSKIFTRGFLLVAPGITIRDRLRVLIPQDTENYYDRMGLVPQEMKRDMNSAVVVITNYHAFQRRDRSGLTKFGREFLRAGETCETEGEMIRRVCSDLAGISNVVVINDEAHHCYREKPDSEKEEDTQLKGEEKAEASENNNAARLWINGLEALKRQYNVRVVYDLSATPFFLKGSGYREGTLFGWTVSDFSLMDAIECGIVKLPRVPITDNDPDADKPRYRDLWNTIGKHIPKSRKKSGADDMPALLESALQALYGHYEKTFVAWQEKSVDVPPVFIVVCNNTATSKMVYDWIAGYETDEGHAVRGSLPLFSNYDEYGRRTGQMHTLLIDSRQIETEGALDKSFRDMAGDEIERFRHEVLVRTNDIKKAESLDDGAILREVMNTVGQKDKLGGQVRCVVSVSMLTEGWDANTVTHIMGVRAFGSQLLCEQVVGRALRRLSYALDDDGMFGVEYADVLGIPFDFTSQAVEAPVVPPQKTLKVYALPERETSEITFPRVEGYSVVHPAARMKAQFGEDSYLRLDSQIGPSETRNSGIVGEAADLTMESSDERRGKIAYEIAAYMVAKEYRDGDGNPEVHRFGQLKRIAEKWLNEGHVICAQGYFEGQILQREILDHVSQKIKAAITRAGAQESGDKFIRATLSSAQDYGTTSSVSFVTTERDHWQTSEKCHINKAIVDSGWEMTLCQLLEDEDRVLAYVKNHGLDFTVPYRMSKERRLYYPDFIVRLDVGLEEPLNLILEVKGFRGIDAELKAEAVETYWIPGVHNTDRYGRWAFAELKSQDTMAQDLQTIIEKHIAQARTQEQGK